MSLQDKYRDQLQIISISEDEVSPEVVKRFAAEHKMNYPIVMTSPELERMFPGVSALPTSFIIDRQSRVVQKHVGMLRAGMTEQETRALAGLSFNGTIEQVVQSEGLKLTLADGAQAMTIPGVDLAKLPVAKRAEALQKLNSQPCTCGCDLTVAKWRRRPDMRRQPPARPRDREARHRRTVTAARLTTVGTTSHTDTSNAWAIEALKTWPELSPWRVAP